MIKMVENPKNRILRSQEGLISKNYGIKDLFNEYMRFLGIATFNTAFFWIMYELLYWLDPFSIYPATFAWAIAYSIGAIEAHYVHRRFTFKSNTTYSESLYWALCVYGAIGVISTISEHFLVYLVDLNHRIAWVINMSVFGFMMFLGLRLLAFPPEMDSEA